MALSVVLTGCARENNDIVVVSREDGSGTRGAFIELFGIEQKDANGNKVDHTTEEAIIVNSTSVVMTTVTGNEKAIGYISLGSLNDTVKALKIDGAEATVANIKNNSYKAYRPFNIATKGSISELAQDFIDYILSSDGQAVVEASGYIAAVGKGPYSGARPAGKIVVAGSSSVTPVMEKLKEAYLVLNPDANIEIQLSDSSTGMNYAMDGTADIGMASRELKDSELKVLNPTVIAIDGIAVIVNKENAVDNLSGGQIKEIFTGEITSWDKLTE
ncbi:MAG: substrate-binding domain-containing protein [Eubacteriales bacterium]|nr:substrate-binding domain-containing protein [Eubacteriales bacterium]